MANQHTKKAAAAAAKKPAPRKRVGVSMKVASPAPLNDAAFEKELTALFARQGITIHGFSAIPVEEPSIAELLESFGREAKKGGASFTVPQQAEPPRGEIPAGLDNVAAILGDLDRSVERLMSRLEPVLRGTPPPSPVNETGQSVAAGPATLFGQYLHSLESRAMGTNRVVNDILNRLEA